MLANGYLTCQVYVNPRYVLIKYTNFHQIQRHVKILKNIHIFLVYLHGVVLLQVIHQSSHNEY